MIGGIEVFDRILSVDPAIYQWDMDKLKANVKNAISQCLNDRYGGYVIFDIEEVKE